MRRPANLAMILAAVAALAVTVAPTQHARAESSVLSLGGTVGGPTGVSLMVDTSRDFALHVAAGFGWIDNDAALVQADLLWHRDIAEPQRSSLAMYFGAGPRLGLFTASDELGLGAHAPFGIQATFRDRPVEVFGEIALGLWVVPDVDVYVDAAIGARYRF